MVRSMCFPVENHYRLGFSCGSKPKLAFNKCSNYCLSQINLKEITEIRVKFNEFPDTIMHSMILFFAVGNQDPEDFRFKGLLKSIKVSSSLN